MRFRVKFYACVAHKTKTNLEYKKLHNIREKQTSARQVHETQRIMQRNIPM